MGSFVEKNNTIPQTIMRRFVLFCIAATHRRIKAMNGAERKFVNLRKRLDQLGYRQLLGIESLPLVERLFR